MFFYSMMSNAFARRAVNWVFLLSFILTVLGTETLNAVARCFSDLARDNYISLAIDTGDSTDRFKGRSPIRSHGHRD